MQNKQVKKIFSISNKYSQVIDILDGVPNQSEFICQAIMEKASRPALDIPDEKLDKRIRQVLGEMVSDKHILIAYTEKNPVIEMHIPTSTIPADIEDIEPEGNDDSAIANAIKGW